MGGLGELKGKGEILQLNYNLKNAKYQKRKDKGILFEINKQCATEDNHIR